MSRQTGEDALDEAQYGPVKVLFRAQRRKYPHGNTILVRGERESIIIDPALGLHTREGVLPRADRVLLSHFHEDHIAGLSVFPRLQSTFTHSTVRG